MSDRLAKENVVMISELLKYTTVIVGFLNFLTFQLSELVVIMFSNANTFPQVSYSELEFLVILNHKVKTMTKHCYIL